MIFDRKFVQINHFIRQYNKYYLLYFRNVSLSYFIFTTDKIKFHFIPNISIT